MRFNASLSATSVGSLPHTDIDVACDLMLESFPEVPTWPQLPAISLKEQMEIQYSEGLPRVIIDSEKERMYFNTNGDPTSELERFYENYLADNLDYFSISPEYARGVWKIGNHLDRDKLKRIKFFKTQVTGPVSFGLSIVDENKRAIYYNELFRDVVVKGMAMKARWMLRKFDSICKKQICVIDEPILSAFGSSTYVSVGRDEVVGYINEMVEAIHGEGGLAGIHCCGNTEWTIPIDAGVDIISFDAFEYGGSITLYPSAMKRFLEKGGVLSWGVVPTSEKIDNHSSTTLAELFESLVDKLSSKGIDRDLILANSLLTASCGTGSVPVKRAERIARETKILSDTMKEKYQQVINC